MYIFLYPQFFQEWQYIDLTSYSKAEYFSKNCMKIEFLSISSFIILSTYIFLKFKLSGLMWHIDVPQKMLENSLNYYTKWTIPTN